MPVRVIGGWKVESEKVSGTEKLVLSEGKGILFLDTSGVI